MDLNNFPNKPIESPKDKPVDYNTEMLEKNSDRNSIESKICERLEVDKLDKMFETINDKDLQKCLNLLENFDPKT